MMKNISTGFTDFNNLLELINLLPEGLEPKLKNLVTQYRSELYTGTKGLSEKRAVSVSSKYCDKLRRLVTVKLANKFIDKFINNSDAASFFKAHWELGNLIVEKERLLQIIHSFQFAQRNGFYIQFIFRDTSLRDSYSFNEDSTIKITGFKVLELLQKYKIPLERVRECPVCKDIFWVKRIEKKPGSIPYCSDPCGKTLNARKARFRDLEKELNKESENLAKLQSNLKLQPHLIEQQQQRISKLVEKIERRKLKYGFV